MTTVFVNGTFDILHPGHISLLEFAKSQGDYLIVGIDTDERVKSKKGPTRPVNNVDVRILMLSALRCVDKVVPFHTDEDLINLVKSCDIMVKGSDYAGKSVIGSTYAKKLIFFDLVNGHSTTNIIKRITDR
jgi:D-beta-D-heptose 7-phosphate kinase/D-beta-D-heptose 1-phosphate adenosyltransferase